MHIIIEPLEHSLLITTFVFVMMLLIEYLNVLTQGRWQSLLQANPRLQYVLAAFLGAIPGCLGPFAVVALYSHRVVTVGAVVSAMIATCGDEAFIMLPLIPVTALLLFGILFLIGIVSGYLTDLIFGPRLTATPAGCNGFELHEEHVARLFVPREMVTHWRNLSLSRAAMLLFIFLFLTVLLTGKLAPEAPTWIKTSLAIVSAIGLFIVATVPEHFLEEHLWKHIALSHVPRIFLWTFGALLIVAAASHHLDLERHIAANHFLVLLTACSVGIIPETGPHIPFILLFAEGRIPFSILLASSIVQDGHGMLPMLAHSRRAFVFVKAINFLVGFAVGIVGLLMHW